MRLEKHTEEEIEQARAELNEWLGNPAFVDEGNIGTTDWTGLL